MTTPKALEALFDCSNGYDMVDETTVCFCDVITIGDESFDEYRNDDGTLDVSFDWYENTFSFYHETTGDLLVTYQGTTEFHRS